MLKLSLILVLAIISVQSTKIGIYVSKPFCLAEALEKNGVDLKKFFIDEYDCKPLENTPEMKKVFQSYTWCSGDYINGTCETNIESTESRSTFGNFEFEVAAECLKTVKTKDVEECGFQLTQCFLPRVAKCDGK